MFIRLSVLCLAMIPYLIMAQDQIVLNENKNESYLIQYHENPNGKEVISNFIIEEIAKSIPKIIRYTEFTFEFEQRNRITKLGDKEYKVAVFLDKMKCSGDNSYKKFNISELLYPPKTDFVVKIKNTNTGFTLKKIFEKVDITNEINRIADFSFSDTIDNGNYQVEIISRSFYYTTSRKEDFIEHTKLIDAYFFTDAPIGEALDKLQRINPDNVDMIPMYDIYLKEINKTIQSFEEKEFDKKLPLDQYDPLNYKNKFYSLKDQYEKTFAIIRDMMIKLDQVYYNKAIQYLGLLNVEMAIEYFEKSLRVNSYFTPSQYQLAKIYFNNDSIDLAAKIVTHTLSELKPDFETHKLLTELATAIYNTYIFDGEKLMKEELHNDALNYLLNCKTFCENTPGIECGEDLLLNIARAKYGIYSSYLTIAQDALNRNKLELAEEYIRSAHKYQQDNSADIISDRDVHIMFGKLSEAYIYYGELENDAENYEFALNYFERGSALCNSMENLPCSEKLETGINRAKNGIYDQLVKKASERLNSNDAYNAEMHINDAIEFRQNNSDFITTSIGTDTILGKIKSEIYIEAIEYGIQMLNYNQQIQAMDEFKKARKLEEEYVFAKDGRLDSLMRIAAGPVIIDNIKRGELKAWGNDIEEARKIYNTAREDQQFFQLEHDSEINNALSNLKEKIFDQECLIIQKDCDDLYRKALQNLNAKDYITAGELWEKAIQKANENTSCQILTTSAEKALNQYRPAIQFQKMINEVSNKVSSGNHQSAIDLFVEAETYYQKNELEQFNLDKKSLFSFISGSNDTKFIAYSASFYVDDKQFDKSLHLLKILKKRNYPLIEARRVQERLGTQMAIADKTKEPNAKAKQKAFSYTYNDKWFKYFKKAYLKSWKKN